MPTNRRKRTRRRRAELTGPEFFYLLCGWSSGGWNQNIPHPNGKELWQQHREKLLEYWTQDPAGWTIPEGGSRWHYPKPGGPGSRPWGFWKLELGIDPPDVEREFLKKHNLLMEGEK